MSKVHIFPGRNDTGFQIVWFADWTPWDHYVRAGRHHLKVGPLIIRWDARKEAA